MSNTAIKNKIDANNVFDCKNLTTFAASITHLLPFRGVSMSRFYACEISGVKFFTKLCFYKKSDMELYGNPTGVIPPTDAEIGILQKMKSSLTDKGVTPCILEMIYYKICTEIRNLIPAPDKCNKLQQAPIEGSPMADINFTLCRYQDFINSGFAEDRCAFVVLDLCDVTLEEYLRRFVGTSISRYVFKSLLFMIIYTMYAINKIYPKFRHYDLHTENVMLKFDTEYKFNISSPKYLVFTIDKHRYYIPYFGIIPKIIDFGYSSLPEESLVSMATTNKFQMFNRVENDLLLLFYWINNTIEMSGSDKSGRIVGLLQKLEPTGSYKHYHTTSIREIIDTIPTYGEMLKNPVWDVYKNTKEPPASQIYFEYTPLNEIL